MYAEEKMIEEGQHTASVPLCLQRKPVRRGKWTMEEEAYVERIIRDFRDGILNVPPGTTLRSYLSAKLNCDPMRITKKFTGDACIGKRVFAQKERNQENMKAMAESEKEISRLEKAWHAKLLRQERESLRRSINRAKPLRSTEVTSAQQSEAEQVASLDNNVYLIRDALQAIQGADEAERIITWLKRAHSALKYSLYVHEIDNLVNEGEMLISRTQQSLCTSSHASEEDRSLESLPTTHHDTSVPSSTLLKTRVQRNQVSEKISSGRDVRPDSTKSAQPASTPDSFLCGSKEESPEAQSVGRVPPTSQFLPPYCDIQKIGKRSTGPEPEELESHGSLRAPSGRHGKLIFPRKRVESALPAEPPAKHMRHSRFDRVQASDPTIGASAPPSPASSSIRSSRSDPDLAATWISATAPRAQVHSYHDVEPRSTPKGAGSSAAKPPDADRAQRDGGRIRPPFDSQMLETAQLLIYMTSSGL